MRQNHPPVTLGPCLLNPTNFVVIAGPCSIESHQQMEQIIETLSSSDVRLMRGGVWKLRTSPDSFQGLGLEALQLLKALNTQDSLGFVTEVTDPRQIETLLPFVSGFQVGARNMYNYSLLKELGKLSLPIILKRAFSATVDEWLKAADYLLQEDKAQVILCERGIRTFETASRYTLDLNGALIAKARTNLPVIIDPSHAVGLREFVPPLVLACAAAGLDGVIIEIHPNPEQALSDGRQSLDLKSFKELLPKLDTVLSAVGRKRL
jgi:3-deoxy-7-phosphoheptulonate synthase